MIVLTTTEIITRIAFAIGLGTIIGLERTLAGKGAGMRTYAMITLGSSVFVIISQIIISTLSSPLIASPLAVPTAVITGIGFIGDGLIILQANKITGLTTAAGLWVSSGVGISVGFGLYTVAIITTIAAIIIFTLMWFIEKLLKRFSYKSTDEE